MTPYAFGLIATLALPGLLAEALAASPRAAEGEVHPTRALRGGSETLDGLVERFLRALRENDRDALRALRIDRNEYLDVILPGSVKPGEKPRELVPDWQEFAWDRLSERNRHKEGFLLANLGGKDLALRQVALDGGEREYAGYTAHRRLRLELVDSAGEDVTLEIGSVAERDGQYKFLSFIRD